MGEKARDGTLGKTIRKFDERALVYTHLLETVPMSKPREQGKRALESVVARAKRIGRKRPKVVKPQR